MIDREARDKAAEALRHFLSERLTNEEFVNLYPASKKDRVIQAIYNTVWNLFDDFEEHILAGKYALSGELKKEVLRGIMFLYTDQEYSWPRIDAPGLRLFYKPRWFEQIIGLHRLEERRTKNFVKHGDYEIWPFIDTEGYQEALSNPVLLRGLSRASFLG